MALTVLDPKTALIVIDLQRGMPFTPDVHPYPEIVSRHVTIDMLAARA